MTEGKKQEVSEETKAHRAEIKLLKSVFDCVQGKALLNSWIRAYIIDLEEPPEVPTMLYYQEGQKYFINRIMQSLNIDPSTIMDAADEEYLPLEV